MHFLRTVIRTALLLALAAVDLSAQNAPCETFTLSNGLTVILHEDHRLPQATVNLWYGVGSKDEAQGRTGFAHLFEHLMFMGTGRAPGNRFDVLMENGGGANNASTSSDRTNYYSWGPSSLLPTLLWLEADRMEGLGKAMTQEKLDLQRSVVRNERRQSYENAPYGRAFLAVPAALYPEGHPYRHPVIGSHEDLEAATLQDVKDFFATYYVPSNATLVVAGDFDPSAVRDLVTRLFGAVPAAPIPPRLTAPEPALKGEVRRLLLDQVEFPRLFLVWPSPAAYSEGDAPMDLAAMALGDGAASRLHRRLVLDERMAQEVNVYQDSRRLNGEFTVDVIASQGGDLERIKRIVLEEIHLLKREGPSEAELKRAKAKIEARFLRRMESLQERADQINAYQWAFGDPDSFRRDLRRWLDVSGAEVRFWCGKVFGEGRLDLRVLPEGTASDPAVLDAMPPAFPEKAVRLPVPVEMDLECGARLYVVPRPGTGLVSGAAVARGGESLFPPTQAGLASLTATLLTSGAGGRDAAAFADALDDLGASVEARSAWRDLTVTVEGLANRLGPTLDLFADALLRPTLADADFERERAQALDSVRARPENPQRVASLVARAAVFGREDPRGRPPEGFEETLLALSPADARSAHRSLIQPSRCRFVFAGDVEPSLLKAELDRRLAGWKASYGPAPDDPPAVEAKGRLILVDRPGAPQTYLLCMRPTAPPSNETDRAARACATTVLGGTFTSRLMQNIREKHGFSYGARSLLIEEGGQGWLLAYSAVQTEVTGKALVEFRREFDRLASGDVTEEEAAKAARSLRFDLLAAAETAGGLAGALSDALSAGRPVNALPSANAALEALEPGAVNVAARLGLFDWNSLTVVLVGDRAAVLPQLREAGLPEPESWDPEGKPLTPRTPSGLPNAR
ncbi:MAG: M16 family metallopeptidase [Acidobacteriota bacterium]